jgi:cathepsin B
VPVFVDFEDSSDGQKALALATNEAAELALSRLNEGRRSLSLPGFRLERVTKARMVVAQGERFEMCVKVSAGEGVRLRQSGSLDEKRDEIFLEAWWKSGGEEGRGSLELINVWPSRFLGAARQQAAKAELAAKSERMNRPPFKCAGMSPTPMPDIIGRRRATGAFRAISGLVTRLSSLSSLTSIELPGRFSAYEEFPACDSPIGSQGACGSCYAFASSTVAAERLCMSQRGVFNEERFLINPSEQDMVSCGASSANIPSKYCILDDTSRPVTSWSDGCDGGFGDLSILYFTDGPGMLQEKCHPYTSGGDSDSAVEIDLTAGKVPQDCTIGRSDLTCHGDRQKFFTPSKVRGEDEIRKAIFDGGPVMASLIATQSFENLSGDSIHEVTQADAGAGHFVVLYGWETDENSKEVVYLAKNSWGSDWGNGGKFKVKGATGFPWPGEAFFLHASEDVERDRFCDGVDGNLTTAQQAAKECILLEDHGDGCKMKNKCNGKLFSNLVMKGLARTDNDAKSHDHCGSYTFSGISIQPGSTFRPEKPLGHCCIDLKSPQIHVVESNDCVSRVGEENCLWENSCASEQKLVCGRRFFTFPANAKNVSFRPSDCDCAEGWISVPKS